MLDKIPKGNYCYEIIEINQANGRITTKICPFWKYLGEQNAYCLFLKRDDESHQGISLLWDQVKECGKNL